MMLLLFLLLVSPWEISADTTEESVLEGLEYLDKEDYVATSTGVDVLPGEFPFMVSVFNGKNKMRLCGGVLITEKHVLTAGYCIKDSTGELTEPYLISIVAGIVDMREYEQDQWRYVDKIDSSPNDAEGVSDLVILEVDRPFVLSYRLRTQGVPFKPFKGAKPCLITGWAIDLSFRKDAPMWSLILRRMHVYIITQPLCLKTYPNLDKNLDKNFVCLVDRAEFEYESNATVCVGDDATVLLCDDLHGGLMPVGLSTEDKMGVMCDEPELPSMFLDLGAASGWIRKVAQLGGFHLRAPDE